jgi:hypothetical protein
VPFGRDANSFSYSNSYRYSYGDFNTDAHADAMHGEMFTNAKAAPNRKHTADSARSHHARATSTLAATHRVSAPHSTASHNTGADSSFAAPYSMAAAEPLRSRDNNLTQIVSWGL